MNWEKCPNGKSGHEKRVAYGYDSGECQNYVLGMSLEDTVLRLQALIFDAGCATLNDYYAPAVKMAWRYLSEWNKIQKTKERIAQKVTNNYTVENNGILTFNFK